VRRWEFVSEFTRDRALQAAGPLPNAGVAHSGIEAAFLGPGAERDWDWSLLYLGRIDERKGADVAVAALGELPAEATLTVIGDGDEAHREQLRRDAVALGVDGRLRIEPGRPRAELAAAYDAHDAVLFPARWDEPWGLVPLEAMARGRPVVSTGRGGSAEYLDGERNCLVVPPDDPAALAGAIARLAADKELRGRLRAAGTATAAQHTDEGFHRAVADALESLVSP
jgi:glycosyltransferase involved in cell wall biosynthesis